jgi:hypothetical protein
LGEEKIGISQRTGNEWKSRMVLLEWLDTEGTQRVWCSLFNEKLEEYNKNGIQLGDQVEVSLWFTTRTYRTGYNGIEANLLRINKV